MTSKQDKPKPDPGEQVTTVVSTEAGADGVTRPETVVATEPPALPRRKGGGKGKGGS